MKKLPLTKKRRKWVASRKKVLMEGTRLSYNASQQQKYIDAILKLVNRMTSQTEREVTALFKTKTAKQFYQTATDENIASQARILTNALTKKFQSLFSIKAKPIVEKMVRGESLVSKVNLKTSLKKLSGGLTLATNTMTDDLKTMLKAATTENLALIKSVSNNYLSQVQKTVMRSITSGEGLPSIQPALEKYKGITERHAKNVAIDQTRKVYNSVNAARMQKIGVRKFKWLHSGGGQKPRKSHIAMNGNVYSFDDLPIINQEQVQKGYEAPERGIPGQAINCGCTMTPIIEFDNEGDQ